MLDAQTSYFAAAPLESDDVAAISPEWTSPSGGEAGRPVEHELRCLIEAARTVLDSVRGRPLRLSARARADWDEARTLLEALGAAVESGNTGVALVVAEDGTWFSIGSERVGTARRGAVKRILLALVRARVGSPGATLSVNDLFELGWPGERIPYESQVRRVYTAIWTLRTLGLDDHLQTRDEGYLLDTRREIRFAKP